MNLKTMLVIKAASVPKEKNWLDPSLIELGYYTSSGQKTSDDDDRYRRFVLTLPAGTYIFSTDLPNCYIIRVLINNVVDGSGGAMQTRTFTLTEEATVKFAFRNKDTSSITDPFKAKVVSSS